MDGVQFWQQRLEIKKEGKWFLRGYYTGEDAGKTYDIFTTGVRLQEAGGDYVRWLTEYYNTWLNQAVPAIQTYDPNFLTVSQAINQGYTQQTYDTYITQYVADNLEFFARLHESVRNQVALVDNVYLDPFSMPGTERFNDKLNEIRSKRFTEGDRRVLRPALWRMPWASTASSPHSARSPWAAASANTCPTAQAPSSATPAMW
ncbi:MAG: hypothetical protein IPJ85_14410 [Flavobacteriales bacterium]|nr:hypothetical protein [Flavobacteriales bacterium]